jgi:hypothetical protein
MDSTTPTTRCTWTTAQSWASDDNAVQDGLLVGFGCAALLQGFVLGRRLWLPVGALLLVPFAFLFETNTGLLLSVLGMGMLAASAWETKHSAGTRRVEDTHGPESTHRLWPLRETSVVS